MRPGGAKSTPGLLLVSEAVYATYTWFFLVQCGQKVYNIMYCKNNSNIRTNRVLNRVFL